MVGILIFGNFLISHIPVLKIRDIQLLLQPGKKQPVNPMRKVNPAMFLRNHRLKLCLRLCFPFDAEIFYLFPVSVKILIKRGLCKGFWHRGRRHRDLLHQFALSDMLVLCDP